MKYGEEFVKSVVSAVIDSKKSARVISRVLGVPRSTIDRWVSRSKKGLPA